MVVWVAMLGCSTGAGPAADGQPKTPEQTVAAPVPLACPERASPAAPAIVRAANRLGWKVLAAESVANRAVSPLSLATTLQLVTEGADETAERALNGALGRDATTADVLPCIVQRMRRVGEPRPSQEGTVAPTTLGFAFALASGLAPDAAFASTAATRWDAEMLQPPTPGGTVDVDGWIARQTRGRITGLLGRPVAGPEVVAVGTLHAKGAWRHPFEPDQTRPGAFHNADGTTSTVPRMHQVRQWSSGEDERATFVGLRMWSGPAHDLQLIIVLPRREGSLDDLTNAGATGWFEQAVGTMDSWVEVDFTLPRFDVGSTADLREPVVAAGVPELFARDAFPGLVARPVTFQTVLQGVRLSVDEAGAEAAAATAIPGYGSAGPRGSRKVVVDRPFLYVLRDLHSGADLVVGRVDALPDASP